jgi:hypothetical protein
MFLKSDLEEFQANKYGMTLSEIPGKHLTSLQREDSPVKNNEDIHMRINPTYIFDDKNRISIVSSA